MLHFCIQAGVRAAGVVAFAIEGQGESGPSEQVAQQHRRTRLVPKRCAFGAAPSAKN